MALAHPYQQYQESQILTTSKGKLLLMTYDGAIRFVRQAQAHMAAKEFEQQNTAIIKAQRIVLELIYTLDSKADPDLAHRLTLLYEYLFNRLIEANIYDDMEALDEVLNHLTELRSAWAEADRQTLSAEAMVGEDRYALAGR
jgi:flagellar protein FliS